MRHYFVDGLRIETSVEVEGLPDCGAGPVDWRVEVVREPAPEDARDVDRTGSIQHEGISWVRFSRRETTARVDITGFGSIVASKVERLATIHAECGTDRAARTLRRAMPYLIALSGGFVLHAACVVVDGGAVVLAGESGAGKSTLALAFDAMSVPVLSDDHVALHRSKAGNASACASFPTFEVAHAVGRVFRPDVIGREAANEEKIPILARTPRPKSPVPVTGLCFVRRGSRVMHERIAGKDVVPLLFHESSFLADPSDPAEHAIRLEAAAQLATCVPATILTVPDGLARLATDLDAALAPFIALGRA